MKYKFFGNQNCKVKPIGEEYKSVKDPKTLYKFLSKIWSKESCAPRYQEEWSKENMTLGQCSITAFLVQDIFGGEIYGVKLPDGAYHCYNKIEDKVFDLTSEQFGEEKLVYDLTNPQSREEHFKSEEKYQRYLLLKKGLDEKVKKVDKIKKYSIAGAVSVSSIIMSVVCLAGGYVGYILLSYYRIGNKPLAVDSRSSLVEVKTDEVYKALSYNLGFGAYSQDFTFFLDTGYDDEGKATCGYYSTAKSKSDVEFNISGALTTAKNSEADFIFFQEVDTNSTRSYHINQDKKVMEQFSDYDHVFAKNFHSAFLPYPLYDMHGSVNAGLATVSKYKIVSAERRQYTISDSLSKLFDLDRCFSVQQINVNNGKSLYIVNSHMSAYDEGGKIRAKQIEELNAFLQENKDHNDYVLIGGDFNHDLITYNPNYTYNEDTHRAFNMTKKSPDWVNYFFDKEGKSPLISGYQVIASDNYPTCRNNDIEWEPGKNFVCTIDGFIVSDNIEVISHENIQTKQGKKGFDGFAFSDHDPASISFKLLS